MFGETLVLLQFETEHVPAVTFGSGVLLSFTAGLKLVAALGA